MNYIDYLAEKDREEHTVSHRPHIHDPFLPRHFVDWLYGRVPGAEVIDIDPGEKTPTLLHVEIGSELTRGRLMTVLRVANDCKYDLYRISDATELTFVLNEH